MSFFAELKRRNVFRVGIAYLIVSWLLLQVIDVVMPILTLPDWVARFFFLLLAVGFIPVLIAAWAFELTPDGVRLERDVDRSQSIAPQTGRKIDRTIIGVLVLVVAFLLYKQFDQPPETSMPTAISEPATAPAALTDSEADAGLVTIAVLPFVNMSSDPEQEYFSDGITEEVLNRLAKIRELRVAARTSVFSFKGQDQDIRRIGQMLGVGTILEGSVRRDGEQIRITAQLIRTSDGFHLWSETYDRKLENIFAIQDDIASQIAASLQVSLGVSGKQANDSAKIVDPQVYDLYLQARALHRQRGEGLIEALNLFQQALDIDPGFAPAWAGLAHSYNVVGFYLSRVQLERVGDYNTKSMAAARRALELDPNLATALHAMGNNLLTRYEWANAQEYYERALKLDPDSTDIMEDYANLLLYSMQLEAARKVVERMVLLDPYVLVLRDAAIDLYNTLGEFGKRDEQIQAALGINPGQSHMQVWHLIRLLHYGRLQEAHDYVDQMNLQDWATAEGMHQMIDWMSDPAQPLNQSMQDALGYVPEFAYFTDRYELWLDSILSINKGSAVWIPHYLLAPTVAPELSQQYRAHPRTRELLRALRLPEYWREVGWPDICQPVGEDDFKCY